MLTCVSAYEAFYHAKHNGRKLRWLYNMGQVEIRCHGLSRQHLLVVSAYQCLALMLFNQRQEDTFRFAWYVCFFFIRIGDTISNVTFHQHGSQTKPKQSLGGYIRFCHSIDLFAEPSVTQGSFFSRRHFYQVTLREIIEATKLPEEECKRQVMSLTVSRHKVLIRDGTGKDLSFDAKLQVNNGFTSDKIKVQVSLIKKEEKAAETTTLAEAPVERKHVIDAAIVRIMKSRNRLEHNALLEEVFRQCTLFKPQPTQIKSQIESRQVELFNLF